MPHNRYLGEWLQANKRGLKGGYTDKIRGYRETGDKTVKQSLPLATVGAFCEGGRKMEDVVHRTGWVALDIDPGDNPHIANAAALRNEVAKIKYVAFSALSVSGKGVWALVKIKDPDRQGEHFDQLIKDFSSVGITLDTSKGRNPNDARFLSYDPDAVIKDDFAVYDRLPIPERKASPRRPVSGGDTRTQVESLISDLVTNRIDITEGYDQWLRVGFALADEFGESGREYFHQLSQFHPDYNHTKADEQFTKCLRGKDGVTIATFFHIAKSHQVPA